MPGATSDFDVRHLASLARLTLTPLEEDAFARQITQILAFAAQVRSVPTEGVPPTTHVMTPALRERADETAASLPPEQALANAPESAGGFFRVPRVLG
jgi:aspartyl-tRNA(Asn)/glutamyl-tRNA(Gln) amidotransferase subunit C